MTDEQKQRYKKNKNKRNKDTDSTDTKYKEELNNEKIIITVIKDNDHFNDIIKL